MKVRVRWTETIEKTAIVEADTEDEAQDDSLLADLDDAKCDEYAVVDRTVLETAIVDAANVALPDGVRATQYEPDWED